MPRSIVNIFIREQLLKNTLKARVTPIDIESQRLCAVSIEYENIKVLLICVYMPCDDNRPNQNIIEFKMF